jgi:hypothetical protein
MSADKSMSNSKTKVGTKRGDILGRVESQLAAAAETALASLLADPTEAESGETGGSRIISN